MRKILLFIFVLISTISSAQLLKVNGARGIRFIPEPEEDPGGIIERDNLLVDHGFEGINPWPASIFVLGQDNLGESQTGTTNTWARQQLTDNPNEGSAYHQIEVRGGCDGCQSQGYRSEMTFVNNYSSNNQTYWYGMSLIFKNPTSGLYWSGGSAGHFIQWHPNNSGGSATLAMYSDYPNTGDGWTLAVNPSGGSAVTHHQSGVRILANQWYHLVWRVHWGTSNNGSVKVWINGELMFNITGLDFNTAGQYMKFGMNRWSWTNTGTCASDGCSSSYRPTGTWTIGYDNLRIGNASATYNDVAPNSVQTLPEPN